MRQLQNMEIREATKKAGVRNWEVAEALGISPCWYSQLLRHEFNDDLKRRALDAIRDLAEKQ